MPLAIGLLAGLLAAAALMPPPQPLFRAVTDLALQEGPWTSRPTDRGAEALGEIEQRRAVEKALVLAGAGPLDDGEHVTAAWIGATDLLRLTATAPERDRARALVDATARHYRDTVSDRHRDERHSLERWAAQLERDAEAAEARYLSSRSAADAPTPERVAATAGVADDVRAADARMAQHIAMLDARLARAGAAHRDLLYGEASALLGDPSLQRRAADLRRERDPDTLANAIRGLDTALLSAALGLSGQLRTAKVQRALTGSLAAAAEAWHAQQRARLIEHDRLAREAGRLRGLADTARSRLETRAAEWRNAMPTQGVVSIAGLEPGARPASTVTLVVGALGGIGVALAACAVASLWRRRRPSIPSAARTAPRMAAKAPEPSPTPKTAQEPAQLFTGALGSLPASPVSALEDLADYLSRNAVSRLAVAAQALAIAHRQSVGGGPVGLTLVVPGSEGFGAATTAMALAHISATAGDTAVMLDCQPPKVPPRPAERPGGGPEDAGLAALLAGERDYHEVLHIEPRSGLHWVPAGREAAALPDRLGETRFTELAGILKRTYDEIYLNAPLASVDSLAGLADALLFVADARDEQAAALGDGLRSLAERRGLPFGLVLVDRTVGTRPAPPHVVSPPIPEFDFAATRTGRMREAVETRP